MRRIASTLSVLTLLIAPSMVAGEDEPSASTKPVFTLHELVERALATSPTVRAAKHKITAVRAQLTESKVSPFSRITATGGVALAPTARGTSSFSEEPNELGIGSEGESGSTIGLSIDVATTIPLYTFGKLRGAWDAAGANVNAAEGDRDRLLMQVRYDVRRAYYALQFALDVRAVIEEGRGKLDRAVSQMEDRIARDDPDVDDQDRFRLSSTLAEIDAQSAGAIRLEASSRAALEILAGVPAVEVPECPLEPTLLQLGALDQYRADASASRAELRMLDSAVRARKAAVNVASSSYYPDVGLVLRGGRSYTPGRTDQVNPWSADSANARSLGGALGFSWSLDLWGNYLRVQRAEAELDQTKSQKDAAAQGIALEVATVLEAVREAQTAETAWQRGERDGRAWFLSAVQAYQVGAADTRDLVDAVKAYFKARVSHLESIRQLNTSLADLERVTGKPLLADEVAWEGSCAEAPASEEADSDSPEEG